MPVVRFVLADAPTLGLDFPCPPEPLAHLPLERDWKDQQRLWGHAYHPMCSYFGSFPATLAHAAIARWSRPGDVVLDLFSGRGTVPLQACAERRIGVGLDLNPLAALLTGAKVDPPTLLEAEARLAHLRIDWSLTSIDWLGLARAAMTQPDQALVPAPSGASHRLEPLTEGVAFAFHPRTLAQLLFLRTAFRLDARADRFLAGATVGILHGRSASYLSTAMPNTFSLPPEYARRYLESSGHQPPDRDVFTLLSQKLRRLYRDGRPATRGIAIEGDAREAGPLIQAALRSRGLPDRARLVVASPPYLGLIRYGAANWLRLWFLGEDATDIDRRLATPHQPEAYGRFIGQVLESLREVLAEDAVVALVIGDVATDRGRRARPSQPLAETAWSLGAEPAGYRLAGISADPIRADRKATRLWGEEAGRATDTDRLLVIAPTEVGRRRALAAVGTPIDWSGGKRFERPSILPPYAPDVSPGRPRIDGSTRPDEEPRPRADDQSQTELRPAAAGALVPA